MSTAFDPGLDLTDEQREIQAVCRDFAAREIRPAAAAVDEADIEVPWDLWYQAAGLGLTSFMLPEELGGGGHDRLRHGLRRAGGALARLRRHRQPDHVERLLRRAGARARRPRRRRSAGSRRSPPTARRSRRSRSPSPTRARTPRRSRPRRGGRATATSSRARRRGSRTPGQARYYVVFATVEPGSRSRGVTAFVLEHDDPGPRVRLADAQDGPARDPERRALPPGRRGRPPTAGSARRARASAG